MLVDIPDDLAPDVVASVRDRAIYRRSGVATSWGVASTMLATRLDNLADGIDRRRADLAPPVEVTAETLTEDAVGKLMVLATGVHDHDIRTRCVLWLDYTKFRDAIGPDIAAEINRRAKAVRR